MVRGLNMEVRMRASEQTISPHDDYELCDCGLPTRGRQCCCGKSARRPHGRVLSISASAR
eukprot:SAG11_NODE_26002_length_351_cov_0.611111_1_plen_59_part_10